MLAITASKLYDYIQCPHKVWRDVYGPQEEKTRETNPFVELLWNKGVKHEEKIIANIGKYLDVKDGPIDKRFIKTIEALKNKTPLIYQGVLKHENLLGIPDLLKLLPDGSYMPIDIKSGSGFEGADEETGGEGKPKLHYAVQLCLYNELLKKLGFANHNNGQIIDIHGDKIEYDLSAQKGIRDKSTWWENYEKIKNQACLLLENKDKNKPSSSGKCKLCPWYNSCAKWCKENDDLTNIFYLGRNNRDIINKDLGIDKVHDLININVNKAIEKKTRDKKFLCGIGEKSLIKNIERAKILLNIKKPVAHKPIIFPDVSYELFFDIEDDPTQESVYLHGVYERHEGSERFVEFTAKEISNDAEKEAWQNFWKYIGALPLDDFAVYFYSQHEKTTYKKLQARYPDVISKEKVEEFFDNPNVIDLYKIVLGQTDWPLGSYSLKALATYLKFNWRDKTPSGALSIKWFNEYLDKKDPGLLKRILEYNEDDCKATMVLKDALEKLGELKEKTSY